MSRAGRRAAVAACALVAASAACSAPDQDTVRPAPLGWGAPGIANDLRGQYIWDPVTKWAPTAASTAPFPQSTAANRGRGASVTPATYYTRVTWRAVERSSGTRSGGFDFSPLDRRIDAAARRGQRTILRVMALDTASPASERRGYPDYLAASVGEWSTRMDGVERLVPDWNDPDYVRAVQRLVQALGARYDGDPRVAGVDLSGYGTWGEWNSVGWGDRLPAGKSLLTAANARTLIDAHVAAFPRTHLFAFTEAPYLELALAASPRIGIRFDCLGSSTGGGAFPRIAAVAAARDRWRTAPVITEFCSRYEPAASPSAAADRYFRTAADTVRRLHVSLVSSGNLPPAWDGSALSDGQWADLSTTFAAAGYRYRTESVRVPASVRAGAHLPVRIRWVNEGSAPGYEPLAVTLALVRVGTDRESATAASSADLRGLRPGEGEAPPITTGGAARPEPGVLTVDDQLPIPGDLPAGDYELVVRVGRTAGDGKGVVGHPEVRLAQAGRRADGSYTLSRVAVSH